MRDVPLSLLARSAPEFHAPALSGTATVTPSLSVEDALLNAPERSGDHFVVPAILGGEGGGA